MSTTIVKAMPYALAVICGSESDLLPNVTDEPVMFNDVVIFVACQAHSEGATTVRLGAIAEVSEPGVPVATVVLKTPSLKLGVYTTEWEELALVDESSTLTNVTIWTNHPTEPDHISIGISDR